MRSKVRIPLGHLCWLCVAQVDRGRCDGPITRPRNDLPSVCVCPIVRSSATKPSTRTMRYEEQIVLKIINKHEVACVGVYCNEVGVPG